MKKNKESTMLSLNIDNPTVENFYKQECKNDVLELASELEKNPTMGTELANNQVVIFQPNLTKPKNSERYLLKMLS